MKLAIEDSWPPYAKKNGEGISKKIISQALKNSEYKPTFLVAPYARVLYLTKYGEVDGCLNVTRQESTEKEFHFGKEPLLEAKAYFYSAKDKDFQFKSIKDLPVNFRLGLIIDYEYGNDYEKAKMNFFEHRVKSQKQIIKMLEIGRIDGAIMFEEVAKFTLKEMKKPIGHLKKGFHNHTSQIYVAFNKHNKKSKEYSEALDAGLLKLKKSGRYKNLFKEN
ncbi:MAG: amino acid ABC transporter substrate-binding protein [Oligoflexia bacterium]|nr:amino acid ABC transporter substrate-binding protein [Oligoflexia bacterium]